MTMHLVKGMTTTRVAKSKRKITRVDYERYVEEHRKYNKRLKQQGRHNERITLEQYIDYVYGKPLAQKSVQNRGFLAQKSVEPYRRETKYIPSVDLGGNFITKTEPMKYTGTLVKGIATMHKSNAVPVINQEEAEAIAKMRR